MGCDIHCFIEYSDFKTQEGNPYWQPFGGEIYPGRDYELFSLLAPCGRGRHTPVYPARGIPDDIGYGVRSAYHVFVKDGSDDLEGYCSFAQAERWIKNGSSQPVKNEKGEIVWVTNPDAHTPSWLTAQEYAAVIHKYAEINRSDMRVVGAGYYAILAAMNAFAAKGADVRFVFWFDN